MQRRKKKKKVLEVIVLAALIGLVVTFAIMKKGKSDDLKSPMANDIVDTTVLRGAVYDAIHGKGHIEHEKVETLTVPADVQIDEMIAHKGDAVKEGQLLATVIESTVMKAISTCDDEAKQIKHEIEVEKNDFLDSGVYAGVSGIVKAVYAEQGMDVTDCIVENGSLALISSDGYMCVSLPGSYYNEGGFQIIFQDGSSEKADILKYDGEEIILGVNDRYRSLNEPVTIEKDGTTVGSGSLSIHKPVAVTAVSGKIQNVWTYVGQNVDSATGLFTLTDTKFEGVYEALLVDQQEHEDDAYMLAKMLSTKGVTAPYDGIITEIIWDKGNGPNGRNRIPVIKIAPLDSMSLAVTVDERNILKIEEGMQATVLIDSAGIESVVGYVEQINRLADENSDKTEYSVKIVFPFQEGMIAGMSADADIILGYVEDALIIENDALQYSDSGWFVFTGYNHEQDSLTNRAYVTIGIRDNENTEILSGLTQGQQIFYREADS